jgi:hypothetical protein
MRLLPLIAATYFMVSGGPYGIEDILGRSRLRLGHRNSSCAALLWSLPTALMIGELASAIPADGGFYVWVRRALGPFWGYQESWLSLSASIFDMALYPAIFVLYLGKFSPALTAGWKAYAWSWRWSRFAACGTCAARRPWARAPSGCLRCCLSPVRDLCCSRLWRGFTLHPARAMEQSTSLARNWIRRGLCLFHRRPGGHVELHGLGQRVHRGAGG